MGFDSIRSTGVLKRAEVLLEAEIVRRVLRRWHRIELDQQVHIASAGLERAPRCRTEHGEANHAMSRAQLGHFGALAGEEGSHAENDTGFPNLRSLRW